MQLFHMSARLHTVVHFVSSDFLRVHQLFSDSRKVPYFDKFQQILGTGCKRCQQLAENAESAAKKLGIDYELEKITDLSKIVNFGIMVTPALVVDDQVKASGKVLSPADIGKILG